MITLYQLPQAFDLPVSVSPYCAKLELYLRLTGRDYRTAKGNLLESPNKKVPYVEGLGGGVVADSTEIIGKLEESGPALDRGLPPDSAVLGQELEALVQGNLYFACLYARFADAGGWVHQRPTVKSLVPWLLSPVLVPVIRRSQVKVCKKNGYADAGAYAKALPVVERVAEVLGKNPFMLGNVPRVADCAVWSNLMHVAYTRASNPAREAVRNSPQLMDYVQRVADRAELPLPALA